MPLLDALVGLLSASAIVGVPALIVARWTMQLARRVHADIPDTTSALGSALAVTTSGLGNAWSIPGAPPTVIAE